MTLEIHKAATKAFDSKVQAVKDAQDAIKAKATEIVEEMVKEWEAKGGCKRCNGTGRMLTWWTMDGAGYDEHGPCTDCNATGGTAGPHPYLGEVRSWGHDSVNFEAIAYRHNPSAFTDLYKAQEAAEAATVGQRSPGDIAKRDIVIVVKGRKVKPGTVGVAVGFSTNQWGTKVGLITGAGMAWVALENCERFDACDTETRKDLMIMWIDSDSKFRASKGLRVPSNKEYSEMCGL